MNPPPPLPFQSIIGEDRASLSGERAVAAYVPAPPLVHYSHVLHNVHTWLIDSHAHASEHMHP